MTHAGFLRAICENPSDDVPRLIYADWLDEHGDPERAEFVRVQCELAIVHDRLHDLSRDHEVRPGDYDRWADLRRRERELFHNTVFWGVDLPFPAHPDNKRCAWRRGFVESASLACNDFLAHAEDLFRAQPVTEVHLTDIAFSPLFHSGGGALYRPAMLPDGIPTVGYRSSMREVMEELSALCVARGRGLAGLPPLPAHNSA